MTNHCCRRTACGKLQEQRYGPLLPALLLQTWAASAIFYDFCVNIRPSRPIPLLHP